VSRELQLLISNMCSRLDVDGLRGDLVINRAAKALVALEGRDTVTQDDMGRVISACLNHRWAGNDELTAWVGCVCGLCVCVPGPPSTVRCVLLLRPESSPSLNPLASSSHRLRKDPLDPIDSGTKVSILFKRLTDPEFVKREEEAKKKQVRLSDEASKARVCAGRQQQRV
jgi:hypothetical protein